MKEWRKTIIFIAAIILGYILPYKLSGHEWSGWAGTILVYAVDMGISRIKYPEMNTTEITESEQMTYAGMGAAVVMFILSLLGTISGLNCFIAYMIIGGAVYIVWRSK